MKRVRICIYGGTDIQETFAGFISALAYQILESISAVIVSGGFLHSNKNPKAVSTDVASEAIYTSFADAIQSSSAVIADITTLNENVMYEIGYSHGRVLVPLIYTRDEDRLTQLPVYFRTLNVRLASAATPVSVLINDYLRALKTARRLHQHSA